MASLADLRTAGAIQQQVRTRNLQNASELVESVSPYLTLTELESEKYGSIDKDNFTKLYEKEPDKILNILNSSPTATTYTDINTGEKAKGKIVNIREQGGKITFDIQGKQGIVPKTLGFSNDPQDIVMATDREGLRTMVNAIVQGSGNRLTSARQGYGSRTQGILNNTVARQNIANDRRKTLEEAESAPEAIGILEDSVENGDMDPREAFAMITQIATDFNDGLDEYRKGLGKDLTDTNQDILRFRDESKTKYENKIMPGDKVPIRVESEDQSGPEQARLDLEAAEKNKQDILTRIGQSGVSMPIYGSPDQIFSFIEQNSDMLEKVGVDQENVDKARAAFKKYNIQTPEDLKTLPEYDSELDINKVELASALAVAAGGDFNKEFQESLNLLETGNASINRMNVQTFNQNTMRYNEGLKLQSQKNKTEARKAAAEAGNKLIEDAYNAFDKDLIAFNTALNKGSADGSIGNVADGNTSFYFKRMIDKFKLAQKDGTISVPMVDGMRTGIGQALYSVMMNRGNDERGIFAKLFSTRDNLDQTLGDIVNTARGKYEEKPGGGLQLKEIIFVDSSNRQVGESISGKEFTDTFNDLATNIEVTQFIKPYRGD